MSLQSYFEEIERKVKKALEIAEKARIKGMDPKEKVEINFATTLAQRAVGLVSLAYPQLKDSRIEHRIRELEEEYGFLDPAVALKIAEEVAKEKFCKFRSLIEAIEAGVKLGFAYLTLSVVVSPIEGLTHIKTKKTKSGKEYLAAYYSGPIRSAGTTMASFSLVIIDHLREIFGFAKYDPTEEEIRRGITEVYDYHERIANLQYLASEEELDFLLRNIPIQIDGLPTEEEEVSNYKDLERIETNFIRGGFCLELSEALAQKASKLIPRIKKLREKGFKLSEWDFLEEFVTLQKKVRKEKKEEAEDIYIKEAVAGRPIFAHPSRSGAFRLRYGRCRTSGYSAVALNPATMKLLENFVAIGTQLKLEKPMKSAVVSVCDTIDGPIVKLKDGSVKILKTKEEAENYSKDVEEILYLGDILISYGDFYDRNHVLLPCGYCEEWWNAEIKETLKYKEKKIEIPKKISLREAIEISASFGVPLHPQFTFFWSQITKEQFFSLVRWLKSGEIRERKFVLPFSSFEREKWKDAKRALEIIGAEHKVTTANVVLEEETWKALALNLGLEENFKEKIEKILSSEDCDSNPLEIVNKFSKFKIKDKAGTFIGCRMGRPEKAKPRELTGSPNGLFPVGEEGGKTRSLQNSLEIGFVKADFPIFFCEKCNKETIYPVCEICSEKTRKLFYCVKCGKLLKTDLCNIHGKAQPFCEKKIDIKHYFEIALKKINSTGNQINPKLVKGVKGTSSEGHMVENLCKAILRAAFGLHVNKDGTIRFDATELPITHFKPKEINVGVDKLRELGYLYDVEGKELTNEEQLLEIKPCDVILPCCPESPDETADHFFVRVAQFIDFLLETFYDLEPFYKIRKREDLLGHLLITIAPHNAAGVAARIIGFSNLQAFLASPFLHGAMRRDCDGDEAGMMLLLDALLNFSRDFIPAHRGATQDCPIVLNARLRSNEVDEMVYNIDIVKEYPLEFYMAAEKGMMPRDVKILQVSDRVRLGDEAFTNLFYTHETPRIDNGVLCSAYKSLATIPEKVAKQMELAKKIRAVDSNNVAALILEKHLLRDIKGNFHKFTRQQFRCVQCNEKYRRPPLAGKCLRCNGRIVFTIAEGSIVKYLELAMKLAKEFKISNYLQQNIQLLKQNIESVFGKKNEKQEKLVSFFS
ncbi:MAG: DNA polymerase II large subunit [Candidatus Pacearchaeota archaeon]|nr:DNA polymerase II large subunit [Candidatus Pacearchaeota archaeon]